MVNIFRGFRTTDIYPFNPLAIPAQACGPSKTSVLAPVTSIASEGEIPSGDKMPVCNEQPTQVPQSSLPISEDNTDWLRLPAVVKEPVLEEKTKKGLCARCVTENEFINEIRQKRREKKIKDQKEKEIRKKSVKKKKMQQKEMEKFKKIYCP